jgi:hypothetical protein
MKNYIRLIREAIRRMTDNGEDVVNIGSIDKYIQNNFWIELTGDIADFGHQLRYQLG